MCCTIKQNKQKSITSQETIIYTKEDLKHHTNKEDTEAYFFEYGSLKFGILYRREYFKKVQLDHLGFYAMSRGFEDYTETGYKSNFVDSGEDLDLKKDIEAFFKLKLGESGIDLDNPKPCFLVHVGGVSDIEQPSLF